MTIPTKTLVLYILLIVGYLGVPDHWCATSLAQPATTETGQDKNQSEPDSAAIQTAIADLSSVKFQKRQTAFEALIESGDAAIAPLTTAALTDDVEAGSRCVEALTQIGANKSRRPAVLEALKRVVSNGATDTASLASKQVEDLSLTDQDRAIKKLESFGEQIFRRGDAPITLLRIKKDKSASQFRFFPTLTSVNLDGPMITDAVIPHLLQIPTLSYLSIKHTSLSDDGLLQIAKCRSVRSLTLQDREISKALVDAIYEFPGLQMLSLQTRVDAEELRLLTKLPKLTSLTLSNLIVSQEGIESLNQLHRVATLSLSMKGLTDEQCKHLANLTLPATLTITSSKDISEQSWISLSEASFTSISLFRCDISDDGLAAIANSKTMKRLSIYGGSITDEGIQSLKGNQVLSSISLHDTKVTQKGAEDLLAALPNVRRIRFNREYIGKPVATGRFVPRKLPNVSFYQVPNQLRKSGHIRGIINAEAVKLLNAEPNLGSVFITMGDPTDDQIARLKKVSMTGLYISSTAITSRVLEPFENHKSISDISISSDRVSDQIIDDLLAMPLLTKISLTQAQISDEGLQRLCKGLTTHDQFRRLALSNCSELSNSALKEIGQLKDLTQLSLTEIPGINADVLKHVGQAKNLTELRLSGVTLDVSVFQSMRHLNLERLHFQGSRLNDKVVARIAEYFPNLTQIGLQESDVTDDAMKSLANLNELQWIYLNGTKVSGDGLEHLTALTNLKYVYASRSEISPTAVKRFREQHPNTNLQLN
ncbi:hypothetical protein [Stieleria marina]